MMEVRITKVVICCLLLFLTIKNSGGQTTRTAQDYLKIGVTHLLAGELDAALANADKAIILSPDYLDAYVLRSLIINKQDPLADDSFDWNKIIQLAPSSPAAENAFVSRATFRLRKHAWQAAIDDLNRAIAITPSAGNYNIRAFAHLMNDQLDCARADYEKSIEMQPNLPSPFVRRGYFRYQKKDFAGALIDFSKAIEWKPDYAEAYADRGIVRGLQGDIRAALSDIRRAFAMNEHSISDRAPEVSFGSPFWELDTFIRHNASIARAYEVRGIFRLLQHREQEAVEDFNRALALAPNLRGEIDSLTSSLRP